MNLALALSILLSSIYVNCDNDQLPEGFLVGFATASYQVEGAWNKDGKGENIWDRLTHTHPEAIADGNNGDIATDQYHKIDEDIQLLKNIGAQTYRFSLSWSRILPDGQPTTINQKGVDYYNKVINGLLANGITPLVTIYHWDLPQRLQDLGGWPNPRLADYFEDFARIVFTLFGDRVKHWMTFNEPIETCQTGYGSPQSAPNLNMSGIADYLCAHTLLYAHARAYHLYNDTFRGTQKGQVGIALSGDWSIPATEDQADKEATERSNDFNYGWFADPIFSSTGDYPPTMRKIVDQNSAAEGRTRSRLPTWDNETIRYIRGTYDFYGLNHYTTWIISAKTPPQEPTPSWEKDKAVTVSQDPSWPSAASPWLKVVPYGIRENLKYIKNKYGNPTVIITENGFSDHGDLNDNDRINYHNEYLREVLKAIYEDGCNVVGYTAWSLLDNFEWSRGYTERFGVIQVDFNSPNRTRSFKKSAAFFRDLLTTRRLPAATTTKQQQVA